jgi:hypothetical protein
LVASIHPSIHPCWLDGLNPRQDETASDDVSRRDCVFWLLLACYQVMSEAAAKSDDKSNGQRYRFMKKLVRARMHACVRA